MHFWIDKRSQCAYTGRHRVPSSLSAGRARGRVCVGGAGLGVRKGMSAPVHRFAAVDCPPRRPRAHNRHPPAPIPTVHSSARRQNDEIYVARRQHDEIYVDIPLEPPHPTIASLAAARSVTPDTLLRTAALRLAQHHSPMMAPHLKYGIMVSFGLATMFLAAAKYYFDRQIVRDNSAGSEATIVCVAVAFAMTIGCTLSMCRAAPPPLRAPDRVSSTARRDIHTPRQQSEPSDDISLTTLLQSGPGESPEAPPPYKIAVLMPCRESPPPPAYSELS